MKISVITPTYNRKAMLLQAIESVQNSILIPYSDVLIEHIIYDDGSTDGTEELFKKSKWKNVLYIQGNINRGQSYAKNTAIQKAGGDFIFLLDSDDIILQRTIYNFIKGVNENPKVCFFVADFIRVNKALKYISGNDYYGWQFKDKEEILSSIFKGEHFIQNNTFFKKETFFEAGMFDENINMAEDLDLYIRFILNGNIPKYLNFISHLHRCHEGNISSETTLHEHMKDLKKLKNKYGIN